MQPMPASDPAPTPAMPLDPPTHVAIIMDGNGRWASARGLPRKEGHRRGVEALRRTVRAAGDLGIKVLTIYSFSAENWSRPAEEISDLMGLLKWFVRKDLVELHKNGIRIRIIGERKGLEPEILSLLSEAEELTKANKGTTLVVAFNYGGRQEITEAARQLALEVQTGKLDPNSITAEAFEARLYTAGLPAPDLVIRTSGEQRISNFLLWQAAYSEFVFMPINWPDFDRTALEQAIDEYRRRERRFGGVTARASA
jgi:undecaprenyl diphosphate synthase